MSIYASPAPDEQPAGGLQLPSVDERTAFTLRDRRGLSDTQIGRIMGRRRETVCRLRARFEQKRARLVRLCSGGDCSLLAAALVG